MPKKKKAKKIKTRSAKVARKKTVRPLAAKKKSPRKKVPRKANKTTRKKNPLAERAQNIRTVAFKPEGLRARAGGQSGDLQGLSNRAAADSESVDELIEEGNAFEAEIVQGVQDAPDADRSEVITHEVPEDDVPDEYL